MADKKATLILELKDKASRGLNKLTGSLKKVRISWLGVTAAVGGAVAFGIKAIKAYSKQEDAINKLNQALKNNGSFSQQASKDIQNYAAELQKVTTVGDEVILEQQALLSTFGATGDELKNATKAALDLSAGLGIDLKAATLLVGKAFAGDISTLSRYGIKIQEGLDESEKFAAVLGKVNDMFGGQAQARLNTFSGKIENLKNRIGDLVEKIGAELLPIFEYWTKKAEKLVGWLEKISGQSEHLDTAGLSGAEKRVEALRYEIDLIKEKFEQQGYLDEQDQIRMERLVGALEIQKKLVEDEKNSKLKADKEKEKSEKKYTKGQLKAIDSRIKAGIKEQQERIKQEEIRKQNFASTLGFISSLSQSENKKLAMIGKAAAISIATIDTYKAANVALASAPPPFNFALAAAVVASGLANVAQISGTKLAEGGIVMPQQGGVQATIAEAGQPEAVIPLEDADSPIGPSITIQTGVLVGGEDSAKALAMMVDKELFRLRRRRESVAFEGL